jgi:lysophospholipase L1-like esterase
MLSPEEIPAPQTLSSANRRLREWAAKRHNVTLVPLAGIMRSATLGQALIIHGITVPEGKSRALLQDDRLHPSTLGAAMLALAIFDAFVSSHESHKGTEVLWDPQAVLRAAQKP